MSFLISDLDSGIPGTFGTSNDSGGDSIDKSLIKKFALNTYASFFNIFEYINEVFTILSTISVNDDTITAFYETEFIKAFPLTKITEIIESIETSQTQFTNLVNSNQSSVQPEDSTYIDNINQHAIIAYRQLDFLTLTVSKITILLELRASNDSLQYYRDTLTNIDKLREYIKENFSGFRSALFQVIEDMTTKIELIEPYNTYVKVYGFPEGAVFESNQLQIIQDYFDNGYNTDEIINLINNS
tara:strand:- start:6761 stop:7489 length:729 start_codon:yes stop_codon:yes gene_type:complete